MATTTTALNSCGQALDTLRYQERWFAAYVCVNHEKRLAEQMAQRSIECFLPLYTSRRQWKDRRVTLQMPLFPGYLFVHFAAEERQRVLGLPGLVRLVSVCGEPVSLPEDEIERLRAGLLPRMHPEPHPYLLQGQRVRIIHGPLAGAEGIFLRRKSECRVVLSVNLIMRSLSVELSEGEILPLLPLRESSSASPLRGSAQP